MLYDPKWEAQTEIKPFTREHVAAWLERQNPAAKYCYTDNGRCLIAQYLTDLGHQNVSVGPLGWYDTDKAENQRAPSWLWAAAAGDGSPYDWTFGRALQRVRAGFEHPSWPTW